jgi:hypothetical protein
MSSKDRALIVRGRDAWERAVSAAAKRLAIESLIGLSTDAARSKVEELGGEFAHDSYPITAKLDANRVVASIVDGRVSSARIG